MSKQKQLIVILLFLTFTILPIFADYVITVKVKDAWTETIHHPEEGYWRPKNAGIEWVVTRPAWTETIEHPPEYETYTVSGGVSPDDLQDLIDDITEGSDLEVDVEEVEDADEYLQDQGTEATEELENLEDLQKELEEDIEEYEDNKKEIEERLDDPELKDPVRMASGEYIFTEEDLIYSILNDQIKVKRGYQNMNYSSHSFGRGWTFNYDMRIVLGVKPRSEEMVALANQKLANVMGIHESALLKYNTSLEKIENVITRAEAIKAKIQSTITALEAGQSSGAHSKVKAVISTHLSNARTKMNTVNSFISRAQNAKTDLEASYIEIEKIEVVINNIKEIIEQWKKESQLAKANENRNQYVINGTDPDLLQYTGNNTVTVIDESGYPHQYFIVEEPNYLSTVHYADGSRNYYPGGSSTIAGTPNDDILTILPDGSYEMIKKDKTRYHYSFYGQLEKMVDLNGNETTFHYDSLHNLYLIKDYFGRETKITYNNGKIVQIKDPKGRTVDYAYDYLDHLISRTDANGDTVYYNYDNNLLSEIIKPDGSIRKYFYTLLNGEYVIDHNIDEEGYSERFSYFPEAGYTEYTNNDGALERYYYNDKKLTTKIMYADGSYEAKEYDEQKNMIQYTDREGHVYHYTYDDNRNMTAQTDPQGNTEEWTYNEWNKIASYTDKKGNVTYYKYDNAGNLSTVTYSDQSTVQYQYDSLGQLVKKINQKGNSTHYAYNDYGYVKSLTNAEDYTYLQETDIIGNLLSKTDPKGLTTTYEYNLDNKVTKVIDAENNEEQYQYNNRKDLIKYTDKNDNEYQFIYDRRHNLIKEINPLGETVEYTYQGYGKVTKTILNGINTTTYHYDNVGNLKYKRQDEMDIEIHYDYNANGQIIGITDPNGGYTQYHYNSLGLVESITDAENNSVYLTYDPNGNLESYTDQLNNTTYYNYDSLNQLIKTIDPYSNEIIRNYDKAGNLVQITDKNGNTSQYVYDKLNQLTKAINPLGDEKEITYDSSGLVTSIIDFEGHTTSYIYDSLNRLIKKINPLDDSKTYSYDKEGNLLSKTNERGNTVNFDYDNLNRLIKEIDPYGNETSYQYNYLGKITSVADALGQEKQYIYDELGQITQSINELGFAKTYHYDANGNLTEVIDEISRTESYVYDKLNQLISKTNNNGETYSYQYDEAGNLAAEVDAKNQTHQYEYDSLNQLIKEINRAGTEQAYQYDANSNLISKTDFNAQQTTYVYDALNQLKEVQYYDGTSKTFSYNKNGQITKAQNNQSDLEMDYDPLGRLIQYRDLLLDQTVGYQYDQAGNKTQLHYLHDKRKINYTYGKNNELLTVSDSDSQTTSFEYDQLMREIKQRMPENQIRETVYDPAGRVTMIRNYTQKKHHHKKEIRSIAYFYNKAGEQTYQLDEKGNITSYTYDNAGRLSDAYYSYFSDKKILDFEERLSLGLFPELITKSSEKDKKHKGKHDDWDDDDDNRIKVVLQINESMRKKHHQDDDEDDKKHSLSHLVKKSLHKYKDFYQEIKGIKKIKGQWQIIQEDGATEFVQELQIDTTIEEQIKSAYRDMKGRSKYLDTTPYVWHEQFKYDANGNRISKANGWGKIDYTYDATDSIAAAGNRQYQHDANGNLIQEVLGLTEGTYTYNPENRATTINSQTDLFFSNDYYAGNLEYSYDAFGRRNSRSSESFYKKHKHDDDDDEGHRKNQTHVSYLYEGLSLNYLAEIDHHRSKNRSKSKTYLTEYIYGNAKLISREKVKFDNYRNRVYDYDKSYYTHDKLGSVIAVTSHKGSVKQKVYYDAFGTIIQSRNYGDDDDDDSLHHQ
ncbi:MAG: DUF6531 domain-containing protein, partial [Spirochaetes bacterium]|nr:DUF6531 domain-containing protein [Spirochaetota bacterium]